MTWEYELRVFSAAVIKPCIHTTHSSDFDVGYFPCILGGGGLKAGFLQTGECIIKGTVVSVMNIAVSLPRFKRNIPLRWL